MTMDRLESIMECVFGMCKHSPSSTVCPYWKYVDKDDRALLRYTLREVKKIVRSNANVSNTTTVVARTKAKTNSKSKTKGIKRVKTSGDTPQGMEEARDKVRRTSNKVGTSKKGKGYARKKL